MMRLNEVQTMHSIVGHVTQTTKVNIMAMVDENFDSMMVLETEIWGSQFLPITIKEIDHQSQWNSSSGDHEYTNYLSNSC